ncbi:metallophosphoesterase [Virgibacillus dokdonensis]|uniref:metallophosphoesterase n=1 Tax=Virgibacillus dokdonensis TaxID=302167 RepID=UPI001131FBF9|nr:metallophosphoesterase [Virgibacillus dokdonensis]
MSKNIAVLTDIHGNSSALNAVLKDIDEQGNIEHIYCLGDLIAIGHEMFTVEDIDEMVAKLTKYGAQLVGEVVQYENSYRLCYIRGTEGLLIGLAEQLGNK